MKFVSEFGLRDGYCDEYFRRHNEIWPEMMDLIDRAGLKNYSIWNNCNKLYEYFECDDFQKASFIISSSEVKKRWDEYMKDILIMPETGSFQPLRCMFDFDKVKKERGENG